MKKIIVYITLAILVAACAPSSRHSGEVTGVGGTAWNEPTPYGMVLISRGSYKMGPAEKDSIWGTQQEPRAVSIDAFWMDETEITNSKYKQFVFWVRDSIIRERLADPAYGGNEVFKIEEDREGTHRFSLKFFSCFSMLSCACFRMESLGYICMSDWFRRFWVL